MKETLTTTWTKFNGPCVFRVSRGGLIYWREDLGQNVAPVDGEYFSEYRQDNLGLQLGNSSVWLRAINKDMVLWISK